MLRFDPTAHYILEDQRVQLRPLSEHDFESLLPFSLNEPDLWTYSLTPADGEENLRNYIAASLEQRSKGSSYPYLVFDKVKQKVAGSTRFYDIQLTHATVQLGYTWYGSEFQGSGLNYHCKYLMLAFAFEELQTERIEFRADAKNARSIAAMKKIGCTVEGILRNNCASPNGRRDSIVLSILRTEWYDQIKEKLYSKTYLNA